MTAKILLVRAQGSSRTALVPSLGLATISSHLLNGGFDVAVYDQLVSPSEFTFGQAMESAKPALVGFSIYTNNMVRTQAMMDQVPLDTPIVVGGPHVTLNSHALLQHPRGLTIVAGEIGEDIVDLARMTIQTPPTSSRMYTQSDKVDIDNKALPAFSTFYHYQAITDYPLRTSRGCPYRCSFCAVSALSGRTWMARKPESCMAEVDTAIAVLRNLKRVHIVDDCPTAKPAHLKTLLSLYAAKQRPEMIIDNVRADAVDDELVVLAKTAGVKSICIAAEHGDPEVLKKVSKGETIEDIKRAATIIHANRMQLAACFITGLPGDSLTRTEASIRLAREMNPVYMNWNMAHPFVGTRMYSSFEEQGATFYDDNDYSSISVNSLKCRPPVVETQDFSRAERVQAYFLAQMQTNNYKTSISEMVYLVRMSIVYGYKWKAFLSLLRHPYKVVSRQLKMKYT